MVHFSLVSGPSFSDVLCEQGLELRRSVLGEDYVDDALARADDFGADFQRYLTAVCWGATWGRPALTLCERSLITLAILATLGRSAELALHIRGALRNGCSADELRDALFHVATYAGVPAGVQAFRVAAQVLADSATEEERDG